MKRLISLFSIATLLSFMLLSFSTSYVFAQQHPSKLRFHSVCGIKVVDLAQCNAIQIDANTSGVKPNASSPSGYNPADLQSAYKLPSASAGSGQTVAIVDAYDDPNAESDLAVYRSKFGLPACTTANGCFRKVNQTGGTSYPRANSGWAEEISLDLDMVSAICPNCHILLVEAKSSSFANLGTAVNTAISLGANTVSNSYGGSESSGESSYASYYNHPGHIITASSGDSGYGAQVPAAYNTVVAVGGTSLSKSSNSRGWTETAWNGAGSGCSAYISKPSWQKDTGCSRRTIADVSAVADPNTGVSVYDTYGNVGGWLVFGGTSVSSPIIASVYALAGNASSVNAASSLYSHTGNLFDVTSGSNGSCGGSYLCTAGTGYDGPTGLGTPNGTGAF
ncbi:S53 family peptidase [Ktedonobacter robiniae]|uniref:Peptidase S8 n=1 Tax=Ktedonobacter robiniae TaxID=2778365 RepID=A0ABQ3V4H6_9CHLR|nr:peptidase S8 [Ktedonobacter robiniae]GHO59380.1 peptidase S8 [Ktedonobacter robiniae]